MALFGALSVLFVYVQSDVPDPRRLQFDTTSDTTHNPTVLATPGPTPDVSSLVISSDEPYIFVDFGNPISWDDADAYCASQLGTSLASVWANQTTRLSEQEQIDLMKSLCTAGVGTTDNACWIGLRYYDVTGSEYFQYQNGQYVDDNRLTDWQPGTTVPDAYFFQTYNEETVCDSCIY